MTLVREPLDSLVVDVQSGFASQPSRESEGLPHLRTHNIAADGSLDLSLVKKVQVAESQAARYSLQVGDVLFNNTNSPALVGKTAYFDHPGTYLFSNHMTRLRVDRSRLDPRFLARYLHWSWQQGHFRALTRQWVSQAAIDQGSLLGFEVPVPPLGAQQRIVARLGNGDALRRKRAEADCLATRVLPALFYRMFGDPVMRFPACRLEKLLRQKSGALQSGPFGSELHNHDFVADGTVLAVGIDNVHDTGFELGRQRRISGQKFEDLRRFALEPDDVLVTVMGTVGRTCVFPEWAGDAICTKHVYRIQTDPEVVHPEFLAACFRFSPSVRAHLGASITGQIVKGLTSRDLRALSLGVPPIDLQRTFARLKAGLDAHLAKTRVAASQLERIYDSLMSRAFSIDAGTPPDPSVASSSLSQEPS